MMYGQQNVKKKKKMEAVCPSELPNCQQLVPHHLNIPSCGNPKFQQFFPDISTIFYSPETDRQMDTPKEYRELIYRVLHYLRALLQEVIS